MGMLLSQTFAFPLFSPMRFEQNARGGSTRRMAGDGGLSSLDTFFSLQPNHPPIDLCAAYRRTKPTSPRMRGEGNNGVPLSCS